MFVEEVDSLSINIGISQTQRIAVLELLPILVDDEGYHVAELAIGKRHCEQLRPDISHIVLVMHL